MKKQKTLNEEEEMKRLFKFVSMTFGHFMWKIRMLSPLSHNEVNMRSSINSSTEWRMENNANCCIHTYETAFSKHLEELNCTFFSQSLYTQTYHAIRNGKCLVIQMVDPDELNKYNKKEIMLSQPPCSKEQLEKRARNERNNLQKSARQTAGNKKKELLKKNRDKKKNTKK